MPWKMIFFLIVMLIVVLFIVFNLNNSSDISFGFKTYEEVPIFLSLFIAFAAGALVTIPMVLFRKRKKNPEKPEKSVKKNSKSRKKAAAAEAAAEESEGPGENGRY